MEDSARRERLKNFAYPIALLTAFGSAYHSLPNGTLPKLDRRRDGGAIYRSGFDQRRAEGFQSQLIPFAGFREGPLWSNWVLIDSKGNLFVTGETATLTGGKIFEFTQTALRAHSLRALISPGPGL